MPSINAFFVTFGCVHQATVSESKHIVACPWTHPHMQQHLHAKTTMGHQDDESIRYSLVPILKWTK